MSGEQRRAEAPQGPQWTLDSLADLHAGALDHEATKELRQQVAEDPAAVEVLDALDAARHDLAALPAPAMPAEVTAKVSAALAEEARVRQRLTAPPVAHLPRKNRRNLTWGIGGLAAAAALLGFVLLSTTMPPNHPENIPSSAASQAPLALSGHDVRLDRAELTEVLRSREYSAALSDPRALNACLRAHGATVDPIAAREITLDGRPAQLFILSTGVAGKFRLLAVGSDCGAEHPATISDSTVGD
jgi:hypothetical protein